MCVNGTAVRLRGHGLFTFTARNFRLVPKEKTPHPHRDKIIKWAEGAEVEALSSKGEWIQCPHPTWCPTKEYRIKPSRQEMQVEAEIKRHKGEIEWLMSELKKLREVS
jgi:hypothetical protein